MGDNTNNYDVEAKKNEDFDLAIVLIPLIAVIVGIAIIFGTVSFIRNRNEKAALDNLVTNITTIANVRYTGYTDDVRKAVYSVCDEQCAEQLDNQLTEAFSANGKIDITDFMLDITHTDKSKGLDDSIILEDGKYYIDTNILKEREPDHKLKPEYQLQCYDAVYVFNTSLLPYNPNDLIGNEDYHFNLGYYESKDGKLDIEFYSKSLKFETSIYLDTEGLVETITAEDFINSEV